MMEITAQEVYNWFEDHIGNSLVIQKKEQQDIDQIELKIDNVRLIGNTDVVDSYILPHTIALRGSGSIETTDGQRQKLPDNMYEIPFIGNMQGVQSENGINIQTERAYYNINIAEN